MMQKPLFKVFIWFLSTFFFFLASGVILSIFKPAPSELEVMKFMEGMMSAMDRSMMGVAMGLENDSFLRFILSTSTAMVVPIILISIIVGFLVRLRKRRKPDV